MRRTDSVSPSGGARRFEEQASAFERRARRIEETQIQQRFRANAHRARKHKFGRVRRILEKNRQAIDQQCLRNAVEHGTHQRFEAHFVRQRAAEFDQRAAIVEAVAVEEAVKPRLHPVAQRLEQKRSHYDRDHRARRARRQRGVERFADQRDGCEINRHHARRRKRISQAALENDVHVHQPVADDGVAEAQRNQRQRTNRQLSSTAGAPAPKTYGTM